MAFTVRTVNYAPLIRTREQSITTWALDTGILEGMQLSGGASGFEVDMTGGKCVINGIVIEEDLQQDPLFTLPSPTNDEHHLIYMRFNPETDSAPVYRLESDRYDAANTGADIGDTDATDVGHSVVIGEVFVPSTATDIGDCAIVNRELIEPDLQLLKRLGIQTDLRVDKAKVLESTGDYTLHVDNAQLVALTHNKQWEDAPKLKPGYTRQLITSTNSTDVDYTSGNDYEITITPDANDNVIVFYARDPEDFDGTLSDLDVYAVSFGDATPGTLPDITEIREVFGDAGVGAPIEDWPDRQDFKNIFILAVVDLESASGAVHLSNGVSMRVGDEYNDGRVLAYLSEITSTGYGTTGTVVAGSLDIDTVIDNAATLHDAGLDESYDGFETGGSPGDGRIVTVDAGAVELQNVPDDTTPADPWNAALRIHMDSAEGGEALTHERGIDVLSADQESERIGMVVRRPYYEQNGSASLLEDVTVTLTNVGGQVQISIPGITPSLWLQEHDDNLDYAEQKWITFSTVTGAADSKSYRLRLDVSGAYFYLETIDGIDTIPGTYAGDFTALPQADAVCTVWELYVKLGQTSVVKDLEVQGDLSGGGGGPLVTSNLHFGGYTSLQDFIEATNVGDSAFVNTGISYMLGDGTDFTSVAGLLDTNGGSVLNTDGRYIYALNTIVAATQPTVQIFNASDGSLFRTVTGTSGASATAGQMGSVAGNGQYVCIGYHEQPGDPMVEIWDIETGAGEAVDDTSLGTSGGITDIKSLNGNWYVTLTGSTRSLVVFENDLTFLDDDSGMGLSASLDLNSVDGYGDYIVCGGELGGSGSISIIDSGNNTVIASINIDDVITPNSLQVYSVAVNDKYIAAMVEDASDQLRLLVWPVTMDGTSSPLYEEVLVAGATHGYQIVRMDEDHIYASWYDSTTPDQTLRVYTLETFTVKAEHVDTFTISAGMDISMQSVFGFSTGSGEVIKFDTGRRAGLWTRTSTTGTTGQAFRWLAMPANGRF